MSEVFLTFSLNSVVKIERIIRICY